MAEEKALPFHSFTFTLLENKRPRKSFRLVAGDEGLYELDVQQGSAANPTTRFTRKVPIEAAERLRDAMRSIGVFGWGDSYGDSVAPGSRRWSLGIVFKEGVFSLESKGGSDVPPGFDDLLEELYRMDFPRPAGARVGAAVSTPMPTSVGDLAAFASKFDAPGFDAAEIQRLLAQVGNSPEALASRMKDEFRHLSPDEQSQMLDALASTGLATREGWERFFRG